MRLEIHIHHHYPGGIMADLSKLQASIDALATKNDALVALANELIQLVRSGGGTAQADVDALQAKVDAIAQADSDATAADQPPAAG